MPAATAFIASKSSSKNVLTNTSYWFKLTNKRLYTFNSLKKNGPPKKGPACLARPKKSRFQLRTRHVSWITVGMNSYREKISKNIRIWNNLIKKSGYRLSSAHCTASFVQTPNIKYIWGIDSVNLTIQQQDAYHSYIE